MRKDVHFWYTTSTECHTLLIWVMFREIVNSIQLIVQQSIYLKWHYFDFRVLTKIYIFSFRMFAFLDLYNNWRGRGIKRGHFYRWNSWLKLVKYLYQLRTEKIWFEDGIVLLTKDSRTNINFHWWIYNQSWYISIQRLFWVSNLMLRILSKPKPN